MKTEIFSLLCVSGMGLYNAPKVFLDSFKNSHKNLFYNHFRLYRGCRVGWGIPNPGWGRGSRNSHKRRTTAIRTLFPLPWDAWFLNKDKIICVLIPASKALTPYSVRFSEVHIDLSVPDPASWKLPQGVRKVKNCKTQGTQETEARRWQVQD